MSATGEQPAARETTVGENSNMKIGLVVTVIVAAMSVGGLYYKVDAQGERITKGEAERAALRAELTALQLSNAVQVTKFDAMTNALNSLTVEVKKMLEDFRGGNRSATYRRPGGPTP